MTSARISPTLTSIGEVTSVSAEDLSAETSLVLADGEFHRAIELKPSYAPVRVWHSSFLIYQGRTTEALQEVSVAQQLGPLSLIVKTQVGWIHKFAGNDEEGIETLERGVMRYPENAAMVGSLGEAYGRAGRKADAQRLLQELLGVWPSRAVYPSF